MEAGSIDFELREGHVVLDDDGRAASIVESERTVAHRCVEEAMLAANREVASLLATAELPALYRVHEAPDSAKLAELVDLLQSFALLPGRSKDGDGHRIELRPIELNRALRRVAGRPEAELVNLVTLRSMRQARYAAENRGHFALAFDSYLHFTSPIRRYADLLVHRGVKTWCALEGGRVDRARDLRELERTQEVADRVSYRERVAVDAEREIVLLKKCAFMKEHVGEELDGRISGVAPHGLYVTLDDFYVDGLVHISHLETDLEFDERHHCLVGRRSGRRYGLGDAMRIRVDEVNQIRAWIRFAPAEAVPGAAPDAPRRASKGRPERDRVRSGRRPEPQSRRRGAPNRRRGRR
jgi:ribonuclease R